jgi:hypothetical protein
MRLRYQGCLRQCTFITKRGSQSTAPSAFWKFSHFLQIVSSCRLQRTSTTFYEDRGPKSLHIHRKMVPWYIDFFVYLSKNYDWYPIELEADATNALWFPHQTPSYCSFFMFLIFPKTSTCFCWRIVLCECWCEKWNSTFQDSRQHLKINLQLRFLEALLSSLVVTLLTWAMHSMKEKAEWDDF